MAIQAEHTDGLVVQTRPAVDNGLNAGGPRWLQGMAHIKRLHGAGPEPAHPQELSTALQQLCVRGKTAQRLAAAKLLERIARPGNEEVISFLLGDTISSADYGVLSVLTCSARTGAWSRVLLLTSVMNPMQASGTRLAKFAQHCAIYRV